MIRGSCLCGGVRFEVERVVGPFELCHCSRCRKVSGSAFIAAVGVMRDAGLFDADVDAQPERHIMVDYKAPWYRIADALPQLDKSALIAHRRARHDREPT